MNTCGYCKKPCPGKNHCSKKCRSQDYSRRILCMMFPVKEWFKCEICGEWTPQLKYDGHKPTICKRQWKPECYAEKMRRISEQASFSKQELVNNKCKCGREFIGTKVKKLCDDCRAERKNKAKNTAESFDRSMCKREPDTGPLVYCVHYSDALYDEFRNCPRENCFEAEKPIKRPHVQAINPEARM